MDLRDLCLEDRLTNIVYVVLRDRNADAVGRCRAVLGACDG